MPYFAAVFAQTEQGWIAAEADLAEAANLDDVSDLMREAAVEAIGDPVLLLVEEDDEWFAVVRLDGEGDPRVFISDSRAVLTSTLAALLHEHIGAVAAVSDGEPSGDPDLLEDLGTEAERLVELSDRTLPSDALSAVAERAGFGEEYDCLRLPSSP